MGSSTYLWGGDNYQGGTAIVLPGIQSYAEWQALGLRPALEEKFRHVVGFDYNVGPFRPRRLAKDIAELVAYWQRNSGSVTLIGMSIGAPMSVLVVDALRTMGLDDVATDPSKFRIIMVDPPFGASTMRAIPDWLKPVARPLFTALSWVVPSGVTMDGQVQVPRDDQLMVPDAADIAKMFRDVIVTNAADIANQKGHSLRTWFRQLAWLTGGATTVPFDGMRRVSVDLIVALSNLNTVVDSSLALVEWQKRISFGRVQVVRAEHCATLRAQPRYARAFRALFKNN